MCFQLRPEPKYFYVKWGSLYQNDPAEFRMEVCRYDFRYDAPYRDRYGSPVNGKYLVDDLALLVLVTPVTLNDRTSLASLNYHYPTPNSEVTIYGIGATETGQYPIKLQTAKMFVTYRKPCKDYIASINRLDSELFSDAFDTDAFYCAYSDSMQHPGDGDSGVSYCLYQFANMK